MYSGQPTRSKIAAAQRNAVGGGRKRCKKGKNCSAACIQSGMICLVEMPESAGVSLGKVAGALSKRAPSMPSDMKRQLGALGGAPQETKPNSLEPWATNQLRDRLDAAKKLGRKDMEDKIQAELDRRSNAQGNKRVSDAVDVQAKTIEKSAAPLTASGGTRYERGNSKDFDEDLETKSLRRVGDKNYNGWEDSSKSGSKAVGEGSYGAVMRNADGTYVKRGAISDTEADIIRTLGERGIGPKLIAADINGKHDWHSEDFVDIRNGRIAMSRVAGQPMGEGAGPDTRFGNKQAADIYWKALGDLHRLGIAHNDAHINNILVDDGGRGRWVDLGLAQRSPKAAFAEAYGTFSPRAKSFGSGGNYQTPRWNATGIKDWERVKTFNPGDEGRFLRQYPVFGQVVQNRSKVAGELRRMGFSVKEIEQIQNTPIRSNLDVFNQGPWAKMTDAQAQKLINLFYDGI